MVVTSILTLTVRLLNQLKLLTQNRVITKHIENVVINNVIALQVKSAVKIIEVS